MNRLIILVILTIFNIQGFSQEKIIVKKGDTVIAKGDHVFTIEDLNKPKPLLKKTIAQVPPVIVNNYMPEQQPVYSPIPNTEPTIVNHYYTDTNNNSESLPMMLGISLMVVSIALLLYHYGYANNKVLHSYTNNCECKKEPATINTFHINGGDANALIDKSSKAKSSCNHSHDLHQNYPVGNGEAFMSSIASELDKEDEDKTRAITKDVINRLHKQEQMGTQEDFPTS